MWMTRLTILLASCAATACAVAPEDADLSVVYKPGDYGDPCPPNGCGGNSPVVSGVYFSRLHSYGVKNPEKVRVTKVLAPDGVTPMKLRAVGDRLEGTQLTDYVVRHHSALVGSQILIEVDGAPGVIRIVATGLEPFWVDPVWASGTIETYDFYYRPLDGITEVEVPLCSEGDGDPNMISAIVFGGDIYDDDTKEVLVAPEQTKGWMNIACVNSAPYKMHKIGYTNAAQARLGYVTTQEQRQAMLRAWTSAVCETGTAFTIEGTPIVLRQPATPLPPESPYMAPIGQVEAIWGPKGALCMSTHRLLATAPDVLTDIATECGVIPECTNELVHQFKLGAYGAVLTGVP